jgi:MoxR-like ATPase
MVMLFGATNEIPEFTELGALRDRFALKIKSDPVGDREFDQLIEKGLRNEAFRAFNQRPWQGLATLADFQNLNRRIAELLMQTLSEGGAEGRNDPFFPPAVYTLFRRILRTLVREHGLEISDRKIIKLYKMIRTRAFVFRGGTVDADDLRLLRYVPDRLQDFDPVHEKVDRLLDAGY